MRYSILFILFLFSIIIFINCKSLKRVWCRVEESCDLDILHPSTIPEDVSEDNIILAKKFNKKFNDFLKTGEILLPDVHESLLTFDKFILKNAFTHSSKYDVEYRKLGKKVFQQFLKQGFLNEKINIIIDEISNVFMKSNFKATDAHNVIMMVVKNLCDCKVIPGNKKPFIDRKEALKFSIVQRSVRDPLINNADLGENVFKAVGSKQVPVEEMEERIKYGIYYDDDYNYLQHLKSRDEVVGDDVETEVILAPNALKKKDVITLSSSLFETKGLEFKKEEVENELIIEKLDDDVMAALDERYDFNNPENQLDDDEFQEILKYGPLDNNTPSLEENLSENDCFSVISDDKYDSDRWDDTKTRFTNYSMSSAVIKRENGLSTLDEKFETFYSEYDDDKIAEIPSMDSSDVAGFLETDDRQFKELMEDVEFKMPSLPKQKISEKEREMAHRTIIGDDELVDYTKIKVEPSKYKKQQWDVESITSTYSNIYNHPRPISEVTRKRLRKTTESTIVENDEMDVDDNESIMSGVSTLSVRPKGETPEERKLRKQAVKEQQRIRRQEKKANKLAFKDEKKLIDSRNSVIQLKARKIH
ncbi:Protein LTV1 homolog [Strongyloides ratti]|uniref:Protein LTV1 homolog n=1 Tax=Strongyloides ratti TaxID=34506 RepID=A0A090LCS3_STRRB|nr:Protein LTV1 homolog [Strongyloides ratti]CEF65290.1 Protein LTV1 homolog [Strongyloides ratti]